MIDDLRIVVQLAIGIVFLLSTPGKLIDPKGFARGMVEYRIVPKSVALFGAIPVIVTEIFLTVSHLTGWLLRFAVPVGLAMLLMFSIAVSINLWKGRALRCFCFGASDGELISKRTLIRLLLLLGGEIYVFTGLNSLTTIRVLQLDRIESFAHLCVALFWAGFLLVAGGWLLSLSDAAEVLRPGTRLNRER
jgi:hypothetical protein